MKNNEYSLETHQGPRGGDLSGKWAKGTAPERGHQHKAGIAVRLPHWSVPATKVSLHFHVSDFSRAWKETCITTSHGEEIKNREGDCANFIVIIPFRLCTDGCSDYERQSGFRNIGFSIKFLILEQGTICTFLFLKEKQATNIYIYVSLYVTL